MPMHSECRQQHLTRLNLNNPAFAIFLPGSTLRAKQLYLKKYYTDPLEAERSEQRDRELVDQTNLWVMRKRQADADGRPFREPFPRYRPEPSPRWERILGAALVRLEDLPMGNVITMGLIILFVLLTFPVMLPVALRAMRRDWHNMLQRDRDYAGDAPCDLCGDRFIRTPSVATTGERL